MLTLVANSSGPSETGVFSRQDTLSCPDSGLSAADGNSPPVSLLGLPRLRRHRAAAAGASLCPRAGRAEAALGGRHLPHQDPAGRRSGGLALLQVTGGHPTASGRPRCPMSPGLRIGVPSALLSHRCWSLPYSGPHEGDRPPDESAMSPGPDTHADGSLPSPRPLRLEVEHGSARDRGGPELVACLTAPPGPDDDLRCHWPRAGWLQVRADRVGDLPAAGLREQFPGRLIYALPGS